MRSLISTDEEKCVGCNKCIYWCPVVDANISYVFDGDKSRTRVDDNKCIMCGKCLDVCDHDARDYMDDTETFLTDLKKKKDISLIAAPSVKTNFPQYKKIFGLFKTLGIKEIYDVSFGADITTWAYLRILEEEKKESYIAQPCPAIVSYIEKHTHDLLEDLIPIQSPMICTAIYLKKYLNISSSLAFFSPCIGKLAEIREEKTGIVVDYNLTFRKIWDYIQKEGLDLSSYPEVDFAVGSRSLGDLYSLPGGLKENVYHYNRQAWVKQVEGTQFAYSYLQELSERKKDKKPLPLLVDILSCQHGCNVGSGTLKNRDITDIEAISDGFRSTKSKLNDQEREKILSHFDASLSLSDFTRNYEQEDVPHFAIPREEDLEPIFLSMHKETEESKNINCNACGYVDCHQMATAIYNGCNHKENCLYYNLQESAKAEIMDKKNKEILQLLNEVNEQREELKINNQRLKEMDRLKTDFISTVSHELRTPLTSVLGFTRIINKKLKKSIFPLIKEGDKKTNRNIRQVTENMQIIISEGERLTNLINDVLDIAKMEAGKMEWQMDYYQLEDIIAQSFASVKSLLEEKDLTIKKDIQPHLPPLYCDRDRIIQVTLNLISNAIKFTPKGTILCRARQEEENLVISVQDQGIGIKEEDLKHIFDKFRQIGDTLTDKPQGTGLGLPICKEIIEQHGGSISAQSTLGEGSTFTFTLPLKEKSKEEKEKKPVVPLTVIDLEETDQEIKGEGKKILVVDDEAHIRALLRQVLGEDGYRVDVAEDGIQALEMIKKKKPSLIILDIMMPHISGFDLAAVLKNDPLTQDIPIVILSIVDNRKRGTHLGVADYFTKPVNFKKLLKTVNRLLDEKGEDPGDATMEKKED